MSNIRRASTGIVICPFGPTLTLTMNLSSFSSFKVLSVSFLIFLTFLTIPNCTPILPGCQYVFDRFLYKSHFF